MFGLQATELGTGAVGILAAGGAVVYIAKKGGKWAVAKTLAVAAAAAAAEQAAEHGLRAAGANETTIRGVRLAAVIVSYIILRRRISRSTADPDPPDSPSRAAETPKVPDAKSAIARRVPPEAQEMLLSKSAVNDVSPRAQALLRRGPGVNISTRLAGVRYRLNIAGGRSDAGTAVTDVKAFEDVLGPLTSGHRMVVSARRAAELEKALGLPTGRLSNGGIISIIDDVASRAPRTPSSGNALFVGRGGGLPGGGPEINIAPIHTAGGGGIRQIILEVE